MLATISYSNQALPNLRSYPLEKRILTFLSELVDTPFASGEACSLDLVTEDLGRCIIVSLDTLNVTLRREVLIEAIIRMWVLAGEDIITDFVWV